MPFFINDFFNGRGDGSDTLIDTQTFYDLLAVDKNATKEQIRKAHRKEAKSLHSHCHPDEHEKYQAAHCVFRTSQITTNYIGSYIFCIYPPRVDEPVFITGYHIGKIAILDQHYAAMPHSHNISCKWLDLFNTTNITHLIIGDTTHINQDQIRKQQSMTI